jgi:hypothetical protein
MNITLRKANAVQAQIVDALKQIEVKLNVEINEFQNPEWEIDTANKTLLENDRRRSLLLAAQYNIRGLVGVANAQSGIDSLLTRAAFTDKRISQLELLVKADTVTDMAVIAGKLEKIKNSKEDSRTRMFGYGDTVTTSILNKSNIEQFKNEILEEGKRIYVIRPQEIQNQLFDINKAKSLIIKFTYVLFNIENFNNKQFPNIFL